MPRLGSRGSLKLLAAFSAACVLIVLAGYIVLRHARVRAIEKARDELAAVADLKLRQITDWRDERLADARFFSHARFVSDDLQRLLARPDDGQARADVEDWLRLLQRDDRYTSAALYDAGLQLRASARGPVPVSPADARQLMEQATAAQDVVMSDVHFVTTTDEPAQEMLIPIYADPRRRTVPPIGAVMIQLDPRRALFPLVQSWPTASQTAETLLVRREGGDILFLNQPRHRASEPMNLRLPLATPDLPAARVLRGLTTHAEGIDYRGVRVAFVGAPVPGTTWFVLTKVDEEELYAPSRQQTLIAALLVISVVLTTILVGSIAWQQRRAQLLGRLRVQAQALESAANGIVITRPDSTIEWVNPAFTRLTGYSAGEVIGQTPHVLQSGKHPPAFYQQMWATICAGRPWHGELINRRKDGSLYDEEMTITPVVEPDGRISHFIAIKQDVTQRKTLEQQQSQAREELETLVRQRTARLSEMVDELEHFSYSITHDLRAPLRAMNTYAVMLERKHSQHLTPEALDFVARIQAAAARMDNLIRDALNYSKAVRTDLPLKPVALGPLLHGVVESYPNLHAGAADITIEDSAAAAWGNEAALTQCFSNLLGNAVKFVAPGVTPRVRVAIEPRPRPSGSPAIRVSIEDNGIGIPSESLETIFGMFQRLHGPNDYPGTGIGLALVRKVVQRMGGTVGVSSIPGRGSTFWIELNQVTDDAPPHDSPS